MIPPSLLLDDAKETSRVIIPSADDNPFSSLALAMSRSIGDYDGKRVGIIATPEIDVWDVNDHFDHEPQTSTGVSIPLDVAVNSTSVVLANSHNFHLAVFCNIRL